MEMGMQNFRKMEFTLPPYNQELESKLLKPQFNKNKFKWPPLQIATLSPRKHLQVAKARLCSLATNTPPPFPRPKVRKEKKEKSQLTSYILFICNSFSRITLIDDSGKTTVQEDSLKKVYHSMMLYGVLSLTKTTGKEEETIALMALPLVRIQINK